MSVSAKLGDKVEAGVNKLGFDLVAEWRKFYTMYSIWAFAIIGAAPDFYNLAVSSGYITGDFAPKLLVQIINTIAFAGAASRLLKQKVAEAERIKAEEAKLEAARVALAAAVAKDEAAPKDSDEVTDGQDMTPRI